MAVGGESAHRAGPCKNVSLQFEELNIKNECCIGRDDAGMAREAVGDIWCAGELHSLAQAHLGDNKNVF